MCSNVIVLLSLNFNFSFLHAGPRYARYITAASHVFIVVGRSGSGKSRIGNTLLGRHAFVIGDGSYPITRKSQIKSTIRRHTISTVRCCIVFSYLFSSNRRFLQEIIAFCLTHTQTSKQIQLNRQSNDFLISPPCLQHKCQVT